MPRRIKKHLINTRRRKHHGGGKKKRERHLKKLKVVAIQDRENITEVVKNGEPRKEKLGDVTALLLLIINKGGTTTTG